MSRQAGSQRAAPHAAGHVLRLALLGALPWLATPARATTFHVSNAHDAGSGSLRQAIADANSSPGADTIVFDAGGTGKVLLSSELVVTGDVDIQGPGQKVFAVDGQFVVRAFRVASGVARFTLSGMTVQNAVVDGQGGGVDIESAAGHYVIRDLTFFFDGATLQGGGLALQASGATSLLLEGCTFLDDGAGVRSNHSEGAGGGLWLEGISADGPVSVTIEDTSVVGCSSRRGAGGGGIFAEGLQQLTIRRSTISHNDARSLDTRRAGVGGGGLFATFMGSPVVIENSTFAHNSTTGWGGAISSHFAVVLLEEATVAGNLASQLGGGLFTQTGMALHNSIVAKNDFLNVDLAEAGGPGVRFDVSYSLVGAVGRARIQDLGGNLYGVDPQLGALHDNGGFTRTMLPGPASPAINAGDPAFVVPPRTDQRGHPRVSGGRIDMGAVEVHDPAPVH